MHSGSLSSVSCVYFVTSQPPQLAVLCESWRNSSKQKRWVLVSVNSFTSTQLPAKKRLFVQIHQGDGCISSVGRKKQQLGFLVSLWLPLCFPPGGLALNEQIIQWLTVARPHLQTHRLSQLLQEFCVRIISTHFVWHQNWILLVKWLSWTRFRNKNWFPLYFQNVKHIMSGFHSYYAYAGT